MDNYLESLQVLRKKLGPLDSWIVHLALRIKVLGGEKGGPRCHSDETPHYPAYLASPKGRVSVCMGKRVSWSKPGIVS